MLQPLAFDSILLRALRPVLSLAASSGSADTRDHLLSVPAFFKPDTTHCIRPQAFRRSLARAHPSDTRFPLRKPGTVAAAPTRSLHRPAPDSAG